MAQITLNATISASIVQTVNLLNVRNIKFGNISPGEAPGTVLLTPTEASTRAFSGGVTLPSGSSTACSAKFIVSGAEGCSYSIILPSTPIMLSNGSKFMIVDNFTSTPSSSGTFTSGSQTICFGAT